MKKTTSKKNENPTQSEVNGQMDDRTLHERIAERAYNLYQKRGQSHGNDLDDWLEAERAVLSEHNASAPTPTIAAKPASRAKSTRKTSGERKAAS
jgi:hypothetical protein